MYVVVNAYLQGNLLSKIKVKKASVYPLTDLIIIMHIHSWIFQSNLSNIVYNLFIFFSLIKQILYILFHFLSFLSVKLFILILQKSVHLIMDFLALSASVRPDFLAKVFVQYLEIKRHFLQKTERLTSTKTQKTSKTKHCQQLSNNMGLLCICAFPGAT